MEWFSGAIPSAIQQSKRDKAVFVVYISGSDDLSKEMDATWNSETVTESAKSNGILALKLDSQSQTCAQFSAIYPVVSVPATYFIGNDGSPIEVVIGCKSGHELTDLIKTVTETNVLKLAAAKEASAANPSTGDQPSTSQSAASQPAPPIEEKAKRAQELLDQRRIEKARKADEESREREKERRNVGRNTSELQQWKADKETKEVQDQIKKDKEEDRKAKERVKEQIARDREDRHRRFQKDKDERDKAKDEARISKLRAEQEAKERAAAQKCSMARIQFRMTDGSFVTEQFPATQPLAVARQFIAQTMGGSPDTFRLCISYPRREFTESDMSQSLADLGLAPSVAIMVLPPARGTVSRTNSPSFLYTLVAPILTLWNFIYAMLFGAPTTSSNRTSSSASGQQRATGSGSTAAQNQSQQSGQQQSKPTSRRDGNVHRLARDDDDDEMNTWNGNSTQQL